MNFTLMSIFPWITFVVPLGFLGGLISGLVGSIFGGGSSSKQTASAQASYAKQLAAVKAEMTKQMNLQAQESKKTLTIVGIGAVGLIMIMFMFMKK